MTNAQQQRPKSSEELAQEEYQSFIKKYTDFRFTTRDSVHVTSLTGRKTNPPEYWGIAHTLKKMMGQTGIKPHEKTVQEIYGCLKTNTGMLLTLIDIFGIAPTNKDCIQEAYRLNIYTVPNDDGDHKGYVKGLEELVELEEITGIAPDFTEEETQELYGGFIRCCNRNIPRIIDAIKLLTGVQPNISKKDALEGFQNCSYTWSIPSSMPWKTSLNNPHQAFDSNTAEYIHKISGLPIPDKLIELEKNLRRLEKEDG